MYIDAQNLYDSAAAHLTTGGSTNVIDHKVAGDLGVGENLYLVVIVTTAFTDSGSDSTMAVSLDTDNDVAFGSVDNSQVVGTFPALSAVGARLVARVQPEKITSRYSRVSYTVANGNLTTGAFTAFLTHDIDAIKYYANGYNIA